MDCWIFSALLLWPAVCMGFEVGYAASMVNFPFVTALYYKEGQYHNSRPFCTGTIITNSFVLTTAGCMTKPNPEKGMPASLYESVIFISAWVGSSFDYVIGITDNIEAKMVFMKKYYLPTKADLKAAFGDDTPPNNKYIINNLTYFYIDYCLLETNSKIVFNNYVHPIPFDTESLENAVINWKQRLLDQEDRHIPVADCFTAGWGSYQQGAKPSGLYRLRYVKVRHTEMIHCTIAYCGNCTLCHLRQFNESTYACFSMYMSGDTCVEDEGAPLFCPWFGYKTDEDLGWGAFLGHLSGKMGSCQKTELPSMFNLAWLSYPLLSRVMKIAWPPPGHGWILPKKEGEDDYEQELQ